MLNSKSITAIAGIVFGALSVQSQAAVTFTNYSYYDIAGYADDYNSGDSAQYLPGAVDVTGFPAGGGDFRSVEAIGGTVEAPEFANAESEANVNIGDIYTYSGITSIYGFADSYAIAGTTDPANQDAYAYGDAVIDIDFNLDSAYSFTFFSEWMEANGNANVYYELSDWDTSSVVFSNNIVNGFYSAWETGTLAAGNYRLIVEAISNADGLDSSLNSGFASGDFGLELTAVPVPAAVWLFGSGLLGLAGVARRKKAA